MKENISSFLPKLEEYLLSMKLEPDAIRELESHFTFCDFRKKEVLLSMGERSEDICLILKGIVRGYYIDTEGNEITKCFSKEGNWCCVYNLISEDVSPFFIETLEETVVARINILAVNRLVDYYPQIREKMERQIREIFIKAEKRILDFKGTDAKKRYLDFMEEYSDVAYRVKQEYVASYLGVTPSSLCRIKREL